MSERIPLYLYSPPGWHVVRENGRYYAADDKGNKLPDNGLLKDYQLIEYIGSGGSSLCYKAVSKVTGRIAIIKELYPRQLAAKDLIIRDGVALYPALNISERDLKRVLNAYENGFKHELESGSDVRFFLDDKSELTNDPRFLAAVNVDFRGPENALNRYQMIDTQAGVFLDKLDFQTKERERVIDILSLEMQILIALKALHNEKHLVHLDLKPANILVSRTYVNKQELWGNHPVILIDFGSALAIGDDGKIIEKKPSLSSTLEYAPSEVKQRQVEIIGKRSDIYSAFIILQKMLLSDAGDYKSRSCELIKESKSVASLHEPEQNLLVQFMRDGIESRKYETVEEMIDGLERVIRVLRNLGVDEVIIKKHAEEKAREIREKNRFIPEMLCEVS